MSKTYKAQNLEEALKLAKKFQKSGKYNLFRGQARDWNVIPTAGRLLEKDLDINTEKLKRLYLFCEENKQLDKYTSNIDWFFAVAQHYGLPTNYIDFTSNIDVAFFFATNSKSNKFEELCSIICLNEDDFIDFVKFTNVLYEKEKVLPPYIVHVDVDNLWRLQAQNGCFLFTPYAEIENLYAFDKIVFPYSHSYDEINLEEIYPVRKSELEILLDQYFNSEKKIQVHERLIKFAEEFNIPVTHVKKTDFNTVIKKNEIHESWRSDIFEKWSYTLDEKWVSNGKRYKISLEFNVWENYDTQIEKLIGRMKKYFEINAITRKTPLEFEFIILPKIGKKLLKVIEQNCQRIWDGTRNLPFTEDEIFSIISKYIFLEIYEYKNKQIFSLYGESMITLEMSNEYGSITRCHASPTKLFSAFRKDIREILKDELNQDICPEILLHTNTANLVFDFEKLIDLFIDEIIPYQVLHNSDNENPTIFYTPSQIAILGYA